MGKQVVVIILKLIIEAKTVHVTRIKTITWIVDHLDICSFVFLHTILRTNLQLSKSLDGTYIWSL